MAGMDLLSDQGFRIDGRRVDELRRISCSLGLFEQADGSAYIEQGNTKVLATIYGPHEVCSSKNKIQFSISQLKICMTSAPVRQSLEHHTLFY